MYEVTSEIIKMLFELDWAELTYVWLGWVGLQTSQLAQKAIVQDMWNHTAEQS